MEITSIKMTTDELTEKLHELPNDMHDLARYWDDGNLRMVKLCMDRIETILNYTKTEMKNQLYNALTAHGKQSMKIMLGEEAKPEK